MGKHPRLLILTGLLLCACSAPGNPTAEPLTPLTVRASAMSSPQPARLVTDTPPTLQVGATLPPDRAGKGGTPLKQNLNLRVQAQFQAEAGVTITWQGTCAAGVQGYEVAFLPASLLEVAGGAKSENAPNPVLNFRPLGRVAASGDNCGTYRFVRQATSQEARGLYIVRTLDAAGNPTSYSNQVQVP